MRAGAFCSSGRSIRNARYGKTALPALNRPFAGHGPVLRDYARLGLLLAHGGNWHGRQLIPADWIEQATHVRPDQPHLLPGVADPFSGYGYQVRIFSGIRRTFAVSGAHGQWMFVDPASRLVMVHTAVRKQPADPGERETIVLWRGVVEGLGSN